jgi:hypothetical protein
MPYQFAVKGPSAGDFRPPNMATQLYAMLSGLPDPVSGGVEQKFKRGQMAHTEALQAPILGPDGQSSTDYAIGCDLAARLDATARRPIRCASFSAPLRSG